MTERLPIERDRARTLAEFTDVELRDELDRRASSALVLPDAFDEFWERYPRKVGKKAARRAWERLDHDSRQAAISTIDEHTKVWWNEGRSSATIPHAATWLNGERWEDEIGYVAPRPERRSAPGMTALRERAARNGQGR